MKTSKSILSDLTTRFTELRERVLERIYEAADTTEKNVMVVAQKVADISNLAREHVAFTKEAFSQINGPNNTQRASAVIARQSSLINGYIKSVTKQINDQVRLSTHAEESLRHISEAASIISKLTKEANILTINARIEATRWGEAGASFKVIAAEMQRLSEQMGNANSMIDKLASQLSKNIPAMTRGASNMHQEASEFSTEIERSAREVASTTSALDDLARMVLKESDATANNIVATANEALSHLQFQDVVEQGLLRADTWFWEIQKDLLAWSGMKLALKDPAHFEMGGDKKIDQSNAGEVLMF
jgi:methyl-accepting chemotaxis protein